MDSLEILETIPPMEAVARLYASAALRRPVRELDRMAEMFRLSNVVRSAWIDGNLVGLLRGWCDGSFDGFIADLAVHPDMQGRGIGKALLDSLEPLGAEIQWVLLSSPLALEYYQKLGWEETDRARLFARKTWDPGEPATWREKHMDLIDGDSV